VINTIIRGDCLEVMRSLPSDSVNLVFTSPPYEAARTYGIGFKLKGQDWVDWLVERTNEMARCCNGLTSLVVEGQTRNFQWSASPALLMADLHRSGLVLRKPPVFHRVGIPGSGGPDWLRNDYEFIVCATKGGKLPWSDNTAMGHPPKWAPGGEMSHRLVDGSRRDKWGGTGHESSGEGRSVNGQHKKRPGKMAAMIAESGAEAKVAAAILNGMPPGGKLHTKNNGDSMRVQCYTPPAKANPGNIIHCKVGGGLMGSKLAHENEAPFPEKLAEFFIRSFCPPDGVVLDPFCGSGTSLAVAERLGRKWIGIDCRQEMVDLSHRRIAEVRESLTLCQ
jgi:DNA modification methylase